MGPLTPFGPSHLVGRPILGRRSHAPATALVHQTLSNIKILKMHLTLRLSRSTIYHRVQLEDTYRLGVRWQAGAREETPMGGRRLVGWLLLGLVTALAAPADAQEERGVVVEVKDDLATGLAIYTKGAVRYDRELEIYSKNFNHLGHTLTVEGVASSWPGTDLAKLTAAVKAWAGQQKTKAPEELKKTNEALTSQSVAALDGSKTPLDHWLEAARAVHSATQDLSTKTNAYRLAVTAYTKSAAEVDQLAEHAEQVRKAAAKPLSLKAAVREATQYGAVRIDGAEIRVATKPALDQTQELLSRLRTNWTSVPAAYGAIEVANQQYAAARKDELAKRQALLVALIGNLQSATDEGRQAIRAAQDAATVDFHSLDQFEREWSIVWQDLSAQHDRLAKTAPGTAEGDEALKDLVAVVSELVQFANADPAQPRLVTTLAPEKTKGDDLTIKATARSRHDNAVVAEGSAKLAISGGLRVRLTSALVGTFGVADDDVTIVQTPADPVAGTPATGRLLVDRVNFDFGDAQLVVFEPRRSREYCWGAAFGTNLLDGAPRRYFVGPTFTYGRGDVRLTIPFGVVFGRVRGLANTINPAGNFAGVSESSLGRRDNQWKVGGYLGVGLGVEF
ncbi:MAG: hypothetical protein HUU35_11495 [Armatimonadetes bacterium]|nr:hypothetical protein [Armatimonadota bacterium]